MASLSSWAKKLKIAENGYVWKYNVVGNLNIITVI